MNSVHYEGLHNSGQGFKYEEKAIFLTALRLFKRSEDFYLACNYKDGEKFDDIVFGAKLNGIWETWFVQLKHNRNRTINVCDLKSDDNFKIQKYFDSYLAIKNRFSNGSDLDTVFSKDFKYSKFVILTTAELCDKLREQENVCVELLDTNPGSSWNIKLNHQLFENAVKDEAKPEHIADFLEKFHICSKQTFEEDMSDIIRNELKTIEDVNEDKVLCKLLDYIGKCSLYHSFLTKTDFQHIIALGSVENIKHVIGNFHFMFSPQFLDACRRGIGNLPFVQLIDLGYDRDITIAMLKQCGYLEERNVIIDAQQAMTKKLQDALLFDAKNASTSKRVLVLVNNDEMPINLFKLLKFTQFYELIVISSPKNQGIADSLRVNYPITSLENKTKEKCLDEKFMLQGYPVTLKSVISDPCQMNRLNLSTLVPLLLKPNIEVGLKLSDPIDYYLPRVLRRHSADPALFNDSQIDAYFALSGMSLENFNLQFEKLQKSPFKIIRREFLKSYRMILFGKDPEDEFLQLAKWSTKPIHWFEVNRKGTKIWYHWRKSTDQVMSLRKYLKGNFEYLPTNGELDKVKSKVVIVTAEPGMGKSTLFNSLALHIKKQNPSYWIVKIVLNDISHLWTNENTENSSYYDILRFAVGFSYQSPLHEMVIFTSCYESGNMVVLLDGFDEIAPCFTEKGLQFLQFLDESPIKLIFVSTRPALRDHLEKITNSLAYSITPFGVSDQKDFLFKYWEKYSKPSNDIRKFIDQVLGYVNQSFDRKLTHFLGIPLQINMIADVFLPFLRDEGTGDGWKSYVDNIYKLYQRFVKTKQEIHFKKKHTNPNAMNLVDQKDLVENYERDLMNFSMLTLLSRKDCRRLCPSITPEVVNELKQKVDNGHEKTGLLVSFSANSPEFTHRTFAEYYAALFLSKNYKNNHDILVEHLFTDRFEFVKYFFDYSLSAGTKLHEAILSNDFNLIQDCLNDPNISCFLNEKDEGGRTPIHLAASQRKPQSVIKSLIEKGAKTKVKDKIFGWSPLKYALKVGEIANIAVILEMTPEKLNSNSVPINWCTLQKTVEGNYLQLFIHLLDNGINECEHFDNLSAKIWFGDKEQTGLTLFHLAAVYDATNILNYLLEKNLYCDIVDQPNSDGLTPLLLAGSLGKESVVKCLLLGNANPLNISHDGKNLIQYAIECENLEILSAALQSPHCHPILPTKCLQMPAMTLISKRKSEWASKVFQILITLFPDISVLEAGEYGSMKDFAEKMGNKYAFLRMTNVFEQQSMHLALNENKPIINAIPNTDNFYLSMYRAVSRLFTSYSLDQEDDIMSYFKLINIESEERKKGLENKKRERQAKRNNRLFQTSGQWTLRLCEHNGC